MSARRSAGSARRAEPTETRASPEAGSGAIDADRARDAGIDAAVLNRLLGPMDAEGRVTICAMCARDIETTRREAHAALSDGDPKALARHLHVMSSLAQTIGAGALAEVTARVQARMRSGATGACDDSAGRMDELARRASRFLAEGTE